MALTVTIPNEYGYVLLTATASTVLGFWHGIHTGGYRKAAKVPYPNAYVPASEAKENPAKHAFNCAQRAQANYIEHQPSFVIALLIAGLRYPVISSGLGVAWCVARVIYAIGYVSKKENGKGRLLGSWFNFAEVGLMGMAGWTGWKMLGA